MVCLPHGIIAWIKSAHLSKGLEKCPARYKFSISNIYSPAPVRTVLLRIPQTVQVAKAPSFSKAEEWSRNY